MSTPDRSFSRYGFAKRYLLPALILFLIPGFSFWFFGHVEADFDANVSDSIIRQIQSDPELSGERKEELSQLYRELPMSRILAGEIPELSQIAEGIPEDLARNYLIFRWCIRIAFYSIVTGLAVFVLALISVLCSLASQQAQFLSLSVGWHLLRLFAFAQVVAQGVLAVALSFWVTAFWFESYSVKLIVVVAVLVLCGVIALVRAIFTKLNGENAIEARLIESHGDGPMLRHLREVASALNTEPPAQILAGIDDNFFVTEHPVTAAGRKFEGRTLFVSLSLLRILTRGEANAVLAHEMAHFSGSDTYYGRKISPLMSRYLAYLQALDRGPVFSFMLLFWSLYQWSLNRISRQREFRADQIAAAHTSPQDLGGALLKISAYSEYQRQVEQELFARDTVHESIALADRVASGYPSFAMSYLQSETISQQQTAHPFDSHPPTGSRLQAVGVDIAGLTQNPALIESVPDSWYRAIEGAGSLEQELWAAYEARFSQAHERDLAYRYLPEDASQESIVLKYFPPVRLENKKGTVFAVTYQGLEATEKSLNVSFDQILSMQTKESLGKQYLTVEYRDGDQKAKQTVCLSGFPAPVPQLLGVINQYYARNQVSREYSHQKAQMAAATPA